MKISELSDFKAEDYLDTPEFVEAYIQEVLRYTKANLWNIVHMGADTLIDQTLADLSHHMHSLARSKGMVD